MIDPRIILSGDLEILKRVKKMIRTYNDHEAEIINHEGYALVVEAAHYNRVKSNFLHHATRRWKD